jgi:4-diphosphocytidyl-2-C-methyl-D-erythritol kinase
MRTRAGIPFSLPNFGCAGVETKFEVDLQKTVPHGAGLGGGSGNAATALWAANELSGKPATNSDLLQWSGEIGSDVSVFFSEGAAYCTGRGEIVENVAPPVDLATPILLVKPPIGLSTPQIFKALDLERRSKADPMELLHAMQKGGKITQELCVNDLEQPAFDTLPELQALKQKLQDTGKYESVFMTGSGSTIVSDDSSLFCAPARLITRSGESWYEPSRTMAAA